PARRVRLSEPVVERRVFHVLDDDAVLEDERHQAETARVEGAEDELLAAQRLLQVVDAVGDVWAMPQLPHGVACRDLWYLQGADVFETLRMGPRVRHPHLAKLDPALAGVRFHADDADVIERFLHGASES